MNALVPYHGAYLSIVDSEGRAGFRSEAERIRQDPTKDLKEAQAVTKLFLAVYKKAIEDLREGNLQQFDAVTGDHNCQVTAYVTMVAYRAMKGNETAYPPLVHLDPMEQKTSSEEIAKNENLLNSALKKQIHLGKGTSPVDRIKQNGYDFLVPRILQYLMNARLLKQGTECIEHPDGNMTLTVKPQKIIDQFKVADLKEIMPKMIPILRASLNQFGLTFVQHLAKTVAPTLSPHLEKVVTVETPHGTFQFQCAVYNMQTILEGFKAQGVYFLLVPYDSKLPGKYLFDASGNPADPKDIPADHPILVIEGFGRLEAVAETGLFPYLLASVATVSQYGQKEEREVLPEDILQLREQGKKLTDFTIAHVYATTVHKEAS